MMDIDDRRRLSPDVKRKMKTPVQLEALERVYRDDPYPPETVRAELSSQLSLSDKQLQMWFCHRRLKDRKEKDDDCPDTTLSRKKPRNGNHSRMQYPGAVLTSELGNTALLSVEEYGEEYPYEGVQRFILEEPKPCARKSGSREGVVHGKRRSRAHVPRAAEAEMAAISAVEAQLGGPLRDDGPPLGLEFDPPPLGAFSTNGTDNVPTEPRPNMEQEHLVGDGRGNEYSDLNNNRPSFLSATLDQPAMPNSGGPKRKYVDSPPIHPAQFESRTLREFQFIPEQPGRFEENQALERATTHLNLFPGPERAFELLQQLRLEEKRLIEQEEKKMRRELERQEVSRRKRDEQIRKEQDRLERERRKEEERARREHERIEREHKRLAEREEREFRKKEKQRHREEARKEKEVAKLKAANERALAKRLAKEMTELMDDEQLELMEGAASLSPMNLGILGSAGTISLDASQFLLKSFPPACVQMKPIVYVQPWSNSDQNVGNLLMVWRFLTTFADVLGLWPFTLDEFVQAFHDYESRLLGEVHVALLRIIVKDIEDAAHAVSSGMMGQRDAITMAAGGHPQLVEAAFAWGFDIRQWGKHVNPITWPEILRQFALAAGFGHKWKLRRKLPDRPSVASERDDREDVVANLRSGAAAASAVASMQGRGLGGSRRSQYRLTPGTVKYAAFHVLSLEGEKGLNIFEVAERIRTSGLRELSSSKTPEASIAAALSRDTNLFERTAPSTYCVRSQFRKDPEVAEEILARARERIRLGFLDEDEAEKEEDDADREDCESDGQDVEGVEDMEEHHIPELREKKVLLKVKEVKAETDPNPPHNLMITQRSLRGLQSSEPVEKGSTKPGAVNVTENREEEDEQDEDDKDEDIVKEGLQSEDQKAGAQLEEETEIDESQVGEPWVQGLLEGEYSDLSVEERLNALVGLVTVANEGNTIRLALEERLEAATALKRQMWAEMQLEKRRHKEGQLSRLQCSLPPGSFRSNGESPDPENVAAGTLPLCDEGQLGTFDINSINTEAAGDSLAGSRKSFNEQFTPEAGPSFGLTAGSHLAERSRAQAKADIGLQAEGLFVFRSLPLGYDRRRNRYWQFVTGNGVEDPGCGRVFFESIFDGQWSVIDTEEAFDALLASLDPRGAREAALTGSLNRLEGSLRKGMKLKPAGSARTLWSTGKDSNLNQAMEWESTEKEPEGSPASSMSGLEGEIPANVGAISVDLGRTCREQKMALERYMESERWMWRESFTGESSPKARRVGQIRDVNVCMMTTCDDCHEIFMAKDKHCHCCHATFELTSPKTQSNYSEHTRECEENMKAGSNCKDRGPLASMPSRLQFLKAELFAFEVVIPSKALKKEWDNERRKVWAASLISASKPNQVLQELTALESMIERDWLSSTYETTEEIVSAASRASRSETQSLVPFWLPSTTAAVALQMRLLDDALAYSEEAKQKREKQEIEDEINQKNMPISTFRFIPEGQPDQDDEQPGGIVESNAGTNGRGRSRTHSSAGGRARGGRGQGRQAGDGGGCNRSTNGAGGGSLSRIRSLNSSQKYGLKFMSQIQEGSAKAPLGGSKQVWGGAAKGQSARIAVGCIGGGENADLSWARPHPSGRRGSRTPGQKQRNPNELMVLPGQNPLKKTKSVAHSARAGQSNEAEDEDEQSNGGDSQAGCAEDGSEDGDHYGAEANNEDLDADEQIGSDLGEGVEDEEEMDEEQGEGDDEEGEVDEEAEEAEDYGKEDDSFGKEEGPREDENGRGRAGQSRYGRDVDVDEEGVEEQEAGGEETEDEDDLEQDERQSFSDED